MFWQRSMKGAQDAKAAYGPGGGGLLRGLLTAGLSEVAQGTGEGTKDTSLTGKDGTFGFAKQWGQDIRNGINSATGTNIDFSDPTGIKKMLGGGLTDLFSIGTKPDLNSLMMTGFGFGDY